MGNKTSKRITARRAASFLAVLGVLVLSSGVALMASATSANAAEGGNAKYFICKYVGTPGVDERLQTGQNPISTSENAIGEDPVVVGSFFNDQHGRSYVLAEDTGQAEPDVSECPPPNGGEEPTPTTASVTFTDPTCDNSNTASYSTSGTGVSFDSPTAAPGATITVHATADSGYVLTGDASFTHTFSAAADCSTVSTPTGNSVSPPKHHVTKTKTKAAAVTPTVVEAGLSGATVQDMRAEQGLALMAAGMVMLVAAGGLGLRLRGGASRI